MTDLEKATLQTEQATLETKWGEHFDLFMGIADLTAEAGELTVSESQAIAAAIGRVRVAEIFFKIGKLLLTVRM